MRKIAALAAVLGLAASPAPAAHSREAIAQLWAPAADRAAAETVTRCVYLRGEQAESGGWLGWVEPLAEEEGDGAHAFTLVDPEMGLGPAPTDFDVAFFADLGACPGAAPEPLARLDGPANEEGTIPGGARFALVTQSDDVLVPFVLTIGTPA